MMSKTIVLLSSILILSNLSLHAFFEDDDTSFFNRASSKSKKPDISKKTKSIKKTVTQTPSLANKKIPIKAETALEQDLLKLGNELQEITLEIVTALGSKEVEEELKKKISEREKKESAFKKKKSSGGYKSGRYSGRSNTGRGKSASSSYGGGKRTGSSYVGSGDRGNYGTSSFSRKNTAGRDKSSSSDRSSDKQTSPTASLGDKNTAGRDKSSSSDRSSDKQTSPTASLGDKNTTGGANSGSSSNTAKPTNSISRSSSRSGSNKDRENRTKLINHYTTFVDKLEKGLKLQSFNLDTLAQHYEEYEKTQQNISKEDFETLKKTKAWQEAEKKLIPLKPKLLDMLVNQMIPEKWNEINKPSVLQANKLFEKLEFNATPQQELQAKAVKRCANVVQSFTRRSQANPTKNKELAAELKLIIDNYPEALLGLPAPVSLVQEYNRLNA